MSEAHDELVRRAVRWLRGSMRCGVVFAEMHTAASSVPDAIGWIYGREVHLVECKVSRSDFHRDKFKVSHRSGRVMGTRRWYLTPPGLIKPHEVPEGWGLLEMHPKTLRKKVRAPFVKRTVLSMREESRLLYSAVERHQGGWSGWDHESARWR